MNAHRIVAAFLFSTSVSMFAAPAVMAKPIVGVALSQAMVKVAGDGTSHTVPLDDDVAVTRSMLIRYTVTAKNSGDDAAQHLSLLGHIPAGTVYVAGSARGTGGYAEFSLDGKVFSLHPTVTVKAPDGTDVTKPAEPELYTMIRWVDTGVLAAHAGTAFSYDVRVK